MALGAEGRRNRVPRRFLAHAGMRQGLRRDRPPQLLADLPQRIGQSANRRYTDRPRGVPPHPHVGAVVEDAPHRRYPRARGPEPQRPGAGGVGADHAADRAEAPAGRIHREAQPAPARRVVDLATRGPGARADPARVSVHCSDVAQPAQVNHDARSHRTGGHPAARAARDQRDPLALAPAHQGRHVIRVGWDRDRCRNTAGDPRPFGIERAGQQIGAKHTAELRRRIDHPPSSRPAVPCGKSAAGPFCAGAHTTLCAHPCAHAPAPAVVSSRP